MEEKGAMVASVPGASIRLRLATQPLFEPGPGEARYEMLAGRPWRESAAPRQTTAGEVRVITRGTIVGSFQLEVILEAPPATVTSMVRDVLVPLMGSVRETEP